MASAEGSGSEGWTEKDAAKFNRSVISLLWQHRHHEATLWAWKPVNADTCVYSKEASAFYDPCQDAANRSIKCLHRNGGDRDMCQDYFQ